MHVIGEEEGTLPGVKRGPIPGDTRARSPRNPAPHTVVRPHPSRARYLTTGKNQPQNTNLLLLLFFFELLCLLVHVLNPLTDVVVWVGVKIQGNFPVVAVWREEVKGWWLGACIMHFHDRPLPHTYTTPNTQAQQHSRPRNAVNLSGPRRQQPSSSSCAHGVPQRCGDGCSEDRLERQRLAAARSQHDAYVRRTKGALAEATQQFTYRLGHPRLENLLVNRAAPPEMMLDAEICDKRCRKQQPLAGSISERRNVAHKHRPSKGTAYRLV